ncbi:hypothetical protein TIFTF001_030398 [Ficus carica]|uniref:Uncharacterized protein n=1 Tax=Ficus carica TaxID=3494 RepID=A0AA88DXI6_FICCA|nr:hypothetical protein TIFTF001_030398 [Ficus carica]
MSSMMTSSSRTPKDDDDFLENFPQDDDEHYSPNKNRAIRWVSAANPPRIRRESQLWSEKKTR